MQIKYLEIIITSLKKSNNKQIQNKIIYFKMKFSNVFAKDASWAEYGYVNKENVIVQLMNVKCLVGCVKLLN